MDRSTDEVHCNPIYPSFIINAFFQILLTISMVNVIYIQIYKKSESIYRLYHTKKILWPQSMSRSIYMQKIIRPQIRCFDPMLVCWPLLGADQWKVEPEYSWSWQVLKDVSFDDESLRISLISCQMIHLFSPAITRYNVDKYAVLEHQTNVSSCQRRTSYRRLGAKGSYLALVRVADRII